MAQKQVIHPMVQLQQKVASLINSKIVKPSDSIGKISLLFGDKWAFLKSELIAYGFTMQDPVSDILVVETWDD